MSHELATTDLLDPRTTDTGRAAGGRGTAALGVARSLFDRNARARGPRSRRTAVDVEAVETRVSLSGFAVRPLGPIQGVEDPNLRSSSLVGHFNPQPDPPSIARGIIAI